MNNFEFSNEQKEHVEEFFDVVDSACHLLQESTHCPDETIDHLLAEAIGSWQIPNLEQLENALKMQKEEHQN